MENAGILKINGKPITEHFDPVYKDQPHHEAHLIYRQKLMASSDRLLNSPEGRMPPKRLKTIKD
jgi:hypothetical protein